VAQRGEENEHEAGMNRRKLVRLALACLLGAPALVRAQQAGKTYRVALLTIGTDPKNTSRIDPFFEAMRELNYVEGRNLVVARAYGDGNFDRLPALIQEILKSKVDVIVTTGNREVIALRRENVTIPIVMTFVDDPEAEGFVKNLARPGGNITGLTNLVPGLFQKYVDLLREVLPDARRFEVIHSPPGPRPHARKDFEAAQRSLGTSISITLAAADAGYDAVLARLKKDGVAGIIAPMEGETFRHRRNLTSAALQHKLPGIYGDRAYVDEGGLMSYSAPLSHRLRRAAVFVDKILRGANPAEQPVEQPTRFELVINMKTAKAMGIKIPRSLLVRADEVIE
jgi:putative tryptophan/tyrosine transport system substrate-binding protein